MEGKVAVVRVPNTQTRRKILDVALELFSSQGYDRTSLREISQRLGFSKAALYYHFRAKEDILKALAGDLIDKYEHIVRASLAAPDRSLDARTATLGELVDLLLCNRATAELLLSAHPPIHHTDIGERILQLLPLAHQALMPPRPTVEDRIRVSAALAIVHSTIDNLVVGVSGVDALAASPSRTRDLIMALAVSVLRSGDYAGADG